MPQSGLAARPPAWMPPDLRDSGGQVVELDGPFRERLLALEPQVNWSGAGTRERQARSKHYRQDDELQPVDGAEFKEAWTVCRPPRSWTSPSKPAERNWSTRPAGPPCETTTSPGVVAGSGREVSTNTRLPGHGQPGAASAGSNVVRPITTASHCSKNSVWPFDVAPTKPRHGEHDRLAVRCCHKPIDADGEVRANQHSVQLLSLLVADVGRSRRDVGSICGSRHPGPPVSPVVSRDREITEEAGLTAAAVAGHRHAPCLTVVSVRAQLTASGAPWLDGI
jgi:hypothetical protein